MYFSGSTTWRLQYDFRPLSWSTWLSWVPLPLIDPGSLILWVPSPLTNQGAQLSTVLLPLAHWHVYSSNPEIPIVFGSYFTKYLYTSFDMWRDWTCNFNTLNFSLTYCNLIWPSSSILSAKYDTAYDNWYVPVNRICKSLSVISEKSKLFSDVIHWKTSFFRNQPFSSALTAKVFYNSWSDETSPATLELHPISVKEQTLLKSELTTKKQVNVHENFAKYLSSNETVDFLVYISRFFKLNSK